MKHLIVTKIKALKKCYNDIQDGIDSSVCDVLDKVMKFFAGIKEPTYKEIYNVAEKYAKEDGLENSLGGWEDMRDAFVAGTQWYHEQLLKQIADREL